jgi:hypothetical protein
LRKLRRDSDAGEEVFMEVCLASLSEFRGQAKTTG